MATNTQNKSTLQHLLTLSFDSGAHKIKVVGKAPTDYTSDEIMVLATFAARYGYHRATVLKENIKPDGSIELLEMLRLGGRGTAPFTAADVREMVRLLKSNGIALDMPDKKVVEWAASAELPAPLSDKFETLADLILHEKRRQAEKLAEMMN